MTGIYTITNTLNGKIYVGLTKNFFHRKTTHIKALRLNKHENPHLQNVYNKYGEIFEFEMIEECSEGLLAALEHYWVNMLNSNNRDMGYNIRPTHPDGKVSMSDETKKKLSEYCKRVGKLPPSRRGVKASEQTKSLQRLNKLGKTHSLETREKMSSTRTGKPHPISEEHLKKRKEQFKQVMDNCRKPENIIRRSKIILQFDLNWNFMREITMYELKNEGFSKIQFRKRHIDNHIESQGFIWKYKI